MFAVEIVFGTPHVISMGETVDLVNVNDLVND